MWLGACKESIGDAFGALRALVLIHTQLGHYRSQRKDGALDRSGDKESCDQEVLCLILGSRNP